MIRTSLRAMVFSCACLGLLVGAEPPSEKLSKHIGAIAVEYLSRIEKVEAFRVGKLDGAKAGTEETVGGCLAQRKPQDMIHRRVGVNLAIEFALSCISGSVKLAYI